MIWREIRIGVFIFALCVLAAVATVAIYERTSNTTASAWLLLPLFASIAVGVLGSELFVQKAVVNEVVSVGWPNWTWSPNQMPVAAVVTLVVVLSLPIAPQQVSPQTTGTPIVGTPSSDTALYADALTLTRS